MVVLEALAFKGSSLLPILNKQRRNFVNYGFIKSGICTNAVVFANEEDMHEFIKATKDLDYYDYDDIIKLDEGFGIGDLYQDGEWSKPPAPEILPETLSAEPDRVQALEEELATLKEQLSLLLEKAQ